MKDKIAFIAVGQAGGNIGQLFESMGYTVLYINTPERIWRHWKMQSSGIMYPMEKAAIKTGIRQNILS